MTFFYGLPSGLFALSQEVWSSEGSCEYLTMTPEVTI